MQRPTGFGPAWLAIPVLWFSAGVTPAFPAEALTLSRPTARQIVQRDGGDRADLPVQGTWSGGATRIEARVVVMPGATNNGVAIDWVSVAELAESGPFAGTLVGVVAGGWYRVEVQALDVAGTVLASAGVDRVGVGDVLVTAGQSNAGCFGSPAQKPGDDRVSAYQLQTGRWQWAADPQPNLSGGMGAGGSAWPILGTLLTQSNQVPVGFVGLAYGGSAIVEWQPGTAYYRNLTNALRVFGKNGIRAVLWHQGESDSLASTTAATYAQRLSNIVTRSRAAAGWEVPWGIAEVSFHPDASRSQEEPVAAGQRLFTAAHAQAACFRGPRTDDFNLERKLSDTVHFNAAGLAEHARQWADALEGIQDLTPKNGNFESNRVLADGVSLYNSRVIGWNRLNAAGTGLAAGNNGYFNPGPSTYANAGDTNEGGVLPNMNGRHAGTLSATTASNAFLQTLRAQLEPSTIYTVQVALGVRDVAGTFGGYRLDLLANGQPLGTGATGDVATLDALAGGSAAGRFTVVACVCTSDVAVLPNQPLAIRIAKPGGSGTYLDFDDVRVSSRPTAYGQWQLDHWGSLPGPDSLPWADPDGDRWPNLIEYRVAGLDPRRPDPALLPRRVERNGEEYYQLGLPKDPSAPPGAVGIEMSYDLRSWFTPATADDGHLIVEEAADRLSVEARSRTVPTAFYRIWAKP